MIHRPTGKHSVVLVDLYAREGKRSGAWEEPIVAAAPGRPPVFTLCANAPAPAPGERGKLTLSNYRTLWHEMGHLMNCVLSQDLPYPSHRNIENGPTDRAEVHSTMNEKRGFSREIIRKIALKDGQPPDNALLDKMEAAQNHMAVWTTLRLVHNARRDIAAHMPEKYPTLADVVESTKIHSPLADLLRPNTFETFHHLFEKPHSPYAGRFYSYLIARIRAVAAWEPFQQNGIHNPVWLDKMRKTLYASGVGGDDTKFMVNYLGKEETVEPFLQSIGVKPLPRTGPDTVPRPSPT
jgi:Zn-dependent oligopeptidase